MSPVVPRSQKLLLGLGESILVTNTLCTGFFLNAYLLEVACLTAGDVATIQIVQGMFDLLNDPLIGTLSDNTRTRYGRRRPWMLLGTCLLPASFFLLFSPSPFGDTNETGKLFYYMLCFCGLSVGLTCFNISVASLVPEMTDDYDERTSLSSYRLAIGNVIGFICLMAMTNLVSANEDNSALGYRLGGLVVGSMLLVFGLVTFFFIKESPSSYWSPVQGFKERSSSYGQMQAESSPESGPPTFLEEVRLVLKNKAYLWLLAIWLCGPTAMTVLQSSLILYCKYIMGDVTLITPLILIVQGMAFLSLPVWIHLSKLKGKRWTYNAGALGLAGFTAALTFNSSLVFGYIVCCGVGFCLIVVYLIPYSMLPDCIEYDEYITGRRREGIYVGFFGFLMKISVTFAIGGANLLLKATGYEAPKESCGVPLEAVDDDDELSAQNTSTLMVIRMLVGVVPAGFFCLAALAVSQYPITKDYHTDLLRKIAEKKEAAAEGSKNDGLRRSSAML
mmetsp:Transcript_3272/g.6875  ORF Transcript_3272/g.6875 Transcript_3272/m.6875 type:complete len:504 (+) Transcript_3272:131-1642(+)